jgi:uncharacterized protein
MQRNLDTVNKIYDAFGRGDVAAILDCLSPTVAWESWRHNFAQKAGVPWMKEGRGHRAAAEFLGITAGFKIHEFKVLAIMANESQVAVEFEIFADVPSTGGRFREEEMHLWTFDAEGKVVRFRHYLDTAKHIAVADGQKTEK